MTATITPSIILFAALYLMFIGFIMKTENLRSTLVFKLLPFVLGMLTFVVALKGFGFV